MSFVPTSMLPFEPSTFSPMHPMHHVMPMHPMHHMPMHPMHSMPVHPMNPVMPMHPMHHVMPVHPMHHMPLTTPFFGESMTTPFYNPESPMTPYFGLNHMTPMHPMTNWMRHQLPREVRDVVFRPMNVTEYNTFVNPIVYLPDGSRMLHLAFDVKGFKPEEVKVEVLAKERAIVVEAKHEVKEKEHTVTRHYSRKFVLPEELHIELSKVELKSVLTHDGLLVLESVLPRITPEELKAIREKAPLKTPYMPVNPILPTGHHAISVPIKMN